MDEMRDFAASEDIPRKCSRCSNDFYLIQSKKVYGLELLSAGAMNGLGVARASLEDMKGRVILYVCAIPQYEIISLNTTLSGITEKDLSA
ncbi:unnamed protein product [Caenorhabditis nigoni]